MTGDNAIPDKQPEDEQRLALYPFGMCQAPGVPGHPDSRKTSRPTDRRFRGVLADIGQEKSGWPRWLKYLGAGPARRHNGEMKGRLL